MLIKILLLAILGSFIGWITNKIAIKMLFKPVKPVKLFFFEIQGVFPKRQSAIAESLGKVVERELIGIEDLKESFINETNIELVKKRLKEKISTIIKENVPTFILTMAGGHINKILEKFMEEESSFFSDIFNEIISSDNTINIKTIVEEKVNKMDFDMFEKILLDLISRELKFVEYIGAILGFVIGILQGTIVIFMR
ncbi:UNVERIFIED_CONTAM: hypothetical protein Cloal_1241 [Acetivibrio alkalicellulosi]